MDASSGAVSSLPDLDQSDEGVAQVPRATKLASEVWSNLEIRHMIVDKMDRKELLAIVSLDRGTFRVVIRRLYRNIRYTDYERFSRRCSSVSDSKNDARKWTELMDGAANSSQDLHGSRSRAQHPGYDASPS